MKFQLIPNFLNFYQFRCKNQSELALCKAIMENLAHLNTIDSVTLAKLSNTSTASITRLMDNFPVKSYKEFASSITEEFAGLSEPIETNIQLLNAYGPEGIIENERNNYLLNLRGNQITMDQINQLVDSIMHSRSITLIGAEHSLVTFDNIQAMLIALHKPTFVFKQEHMLEEHIKSLKSNDLVIFISLHNRYQAIYGDHHLNYLNKHQVPCIMLSQYHYEDTSKFKQVIYFGRDHDWNHGYYSLNMLVEYLESIIYYKMKQ